MSFSADRRMTGDWVGQYATILADALLPHRWHREERARKRLDKAGYKASNELLVRLLQRRTPTGRVPCEVFTDPFAYLRSGWRRGTRRPAPVSPTSSRWNEPLNADTDLSPRTRAGAASQKRSFADAGAGSGQSVAVLGMAV